MNNDYRHLVSQSIQFNTNCNTGCKSESKFMIENKFKCKGNELNLRALWLVLLGFLLQKKYQKEK